MAVRFVLGRAGSGKTFRCLQAVRDQLRLTPVGPPLVLLVPEQATFQMERALIETPGLSGFVRAQVLSFARLIHRVLEIAGGTAKPRLGEVGRRMLLRSLLLRLEPELQVFGGYADRPGFLERLSRLLGELHAYAHRPEEVEAALAALSGDSPGGPAPSFLVAKLHDLGLIYRRYQEELRERGCLDPDVAVDRAALALEEMGRSGCSPFAGASLWVDGFAGFTPQEYRLLGALLQQAREAEIALCVEPSLCLDEPPYVRWVPEWQAANSRVPVATSLARASWSRAVAPPALATGQFESDQSDAFMFAPTLRTYRELRERLDELGVAVGPAVRLSPVVPPRFGSASLLARIERELGSATSPSAGSTASGVKGAAGGAAGGCPSYRQGGQLQLVEASNRRLEVEAAASEILRLCREEGYRYREISVLTWSLEPFQALVENVFREYGIPYFLDLRRSLAHHPLIELVRSAVETVKSDFAREPLFRLFKTDLMPVGRDEVDRLEEYAFQHGLEGRRIWTTGEPWSYWRRYTLSYTPEEDGLIGNHLADGAAGRAETPAGDSGQSPRQTEGGREKGGREEVREKELRELDRIRRRAIQGLEALARDMEAIEQAGAQGSAREYVRALYRFLVGQRIEEQLAQWAEEARARGDWDKAREHEEAWPLLMEFFQEIVDGLGDQALTLPQFARVLESGLEGLTLGLVPPTLDQVIVGSVERSRTPAVRATLVLGVADGSFPPVPEEDSFFPDEERDLLARVRFNLADTAGTRLLHQRYLVYIALTRPSERLWVSYSQSDEAGRALRPAAAFRQLQALFPDLPVIRVTSSTTGLPPAGWGPLAARVAAELRQNGARWAPVVPLLQGHPEAQKVLSSLEETNDLPPLPGEIAGPLYGIREDTGCLPTSVSRLETFAACPFRHFAEYGLRLAEWQEPRLEATMWGEFVHESLRRFVSEWHQSGAGTDVIPRLRQVFTSMSSLLTRELPDSSELRFQIELLWRVLAAAVPALVAQIEGGSFRPWALEAGFELRVGKVLVKGRIDRLDVAVRGDTRYVRVIDYKTGRARWKLEEVADGLSLQLPFYLLAAVEQLAQLGQFAPDGDRRTEVVPAGLFYFPVAWQDRRLDRPPEAGDEQPETADLDRERVKLYQLRGLVVRDEPVPELMDGQVTRGGGSSVLVPLRLRKDGQPHAGQAGQVTREQMEALLSYVKQKVVQLGGQMAAGEVAPRPWRRVKGRACSGCPFHPLCRFDRRLPGGGYRWLTDRSREDLWEEITADAGRADDEGE